MSWVRVFHSAVQDETDPTTELAYSLRFCRWHCEVQLQGKRLGPMEGWASWPGNRTRVQSR